MDPNQDLNQIILDVYDTAIAPEQWPVVLHNVARFVGAQGAFIFGMEGQGAERRISAPHFSANYDLDVVRNYLETHTALELADQDVFARHSKMTDEIELISDAVLAETREELETRANVIEMAKYGLAYRAGALLDKDHLNRDRFALQFSADRGPLKPEHQARAKLIMPHIAKALNVSRPVNQLAQQHMAIFNSFDKLLIGVCIIDSRGSIILTNTEFKRQLDRYKVFQKDAHGRLKIGSDQVTQRFSSLTSSAQKHGAFGARPRKEAIVAELDGEAHTLCIDISPLGGAEELGEEKLMGSIIYSMDTSQSYAIDKAVVSELFDLTGTESSVLEMMAEGLTNAQISDRRNRSIETVNSQVKAILQKTNSSNRTQAIRLATNISASFLVEKPEVSEAIRKAVRKD